MDQQLEPPTGSPSRIPDFHSREEEAEFWDTHDVTDYLHELRPVKFSYVVNPSAGMTIRLDPEDLDALSRLAAERGVRPSTLVRMWIKERLKAEQRGSGTPAEMEERMAITFDHQDAAYLRWIDQHPQGFVVNTFRRPSRDYLILHRTTCGTISGTPARGSTWTDGDYIKICAETVPDLRQWAARNAGGELHACGLCHPE